MFGPKLSTQGEIAEADVFNITWTGSSISLECVLPFRYSPQKGLYRIGVKLRWVTIETCRSQIPQILIGPNSDGFRLVPP